MRIALLTISDSRTLAQDRSGDYLQTALLADGHTLSARDLVSDDKYQLRAKVSHWIADPTVDVILLTGGTGFTGRDGTPEAIFPLLDKEMPGFSALMHYLSFQEISTSTLQSRAFAGLANQTFVFALPGSRNACQMAWEKLIRPQLDAGTKPCNLAQIWPRLGESPEHPRQNPTAD